jgi:invasion protein IalB
MSASGIGSEKWVVECLSGEGGSPVCDIVEAMCAETRGLIGAGLAVTVDSGRGKRFAGGSFPVLVLREGAVVSTDDSRTSGRWGDLSLET